MDPGHGGLGFGLTFRDHDLLTVAHDGTAGDDANEGVAVINDGDKVLLAGPGDQVLHGGGDGNGDIIPPVGYLHNAVIFRIPQVQTTQVLQRPQQIPLRQGAAIFALLVQDGQGRIAGTFHPLQGLAHGIIIFQIGTAALWRQKKQNIHVLAPFGVID